VEAVHSAWDTTTTGRDEKTPARTTCPMTPSIATSARKEGEGREA